MFLNLTPGELEAVLLSLRVASLSVLFSLPLAVATGWLLARYDFPGKTLVDGLVHLPLVLPPVVTGYLLLILLGTQGPVGAWLNETFGVQLAFRWTGAVVAAAVMAFPLMVRPIRLSLEAIDRKLPEAAITLGAGRFVVFFTVILPLALPGVLAGAVLGFAKALGEFGATITFAANIPGETRTLPSAIYTYVQIPGGEEAAARLVVVAVVLSLVALILAEALGRVLGNWVRGA